VERIGERSGERERERARENKATSLGKERVGGALNGNTHLAGHARTTNTKRAAELIDSPSSFSSLLQFGMLHY